MTAPPQPLTAAYLPPKPPRARAPPASDFPEPEIPRAPWSCPDAERALQAHYTLYKNLYTSERNR